jgi:hypothetical protein
VSQVVKEEKRGVVRGVLVRLRMYAEILWAYLRAPSYARTRAGEARGELRHPPAAAHARGPAPQRAPAAQRKAPRR